MRTYRAEVIGQFDRPQGEVRDQLRREQPEHDLMASSFSPDGTLSYGPSLTRFTFKYLLEVDEDSSVIADETAATEAELRAEAHLLERSIPYRALAVSLTCLEDVKPRRRR